MFSLTSRTTLDEEFTESSMLLDKEFDEQGVITEPHVLLFLLTDDPHHFNLS